MPRFEITGPDGAKYQVDGPEGATEQDALAQVQKQMAPSPAAPSTNIAAEQGMAPPPSLPGPQGSTAAAWGDAAQRIGAGVTDAGKAIAGAAVSVPAVDDSGRVMTPITPAAAAAPLPTPTDLRDKLQQADMDALTALQPGPDAGMAERFGRRAAQLGVHTAATIAGMPLNAMIGVGQGPSGAVTINPETNTMGLTPEASAAASFAVSPLRFGHAALDPIAAIGAAPDINGAIAAAGAAAKAPVGDAGAALASAETPQLRLLRQTEGAILRRVGGDEARLTDIDQRRLVSLRALTERVRGQAADDIPTVTVTATPAVAEKQIATAIPKTSAEAKAVATAYYQRADQVGGTLLPEFANKFIDEAESIAPQTVEGRAIAGDTAITGLVDRIQALRDQPISLRGAQEIDERLGDLIDKEYGLKGLSKEGHNLLDLQTTFRNMILDAGPEDTTSGLAGFEAIKQGRMAWAQAMKMMDFERILNRAEQTDNPVTSIRAGIRTLTSNPARIRGYSPEEIDALKDAAKRGVIGGVLHVFGNRLAPLAVGAAGYTTGIIPGLVGAGVMHGASAGIRNLATKIQTHRADNAMSVLGSGVPSMPSELSSGTSSLPVPAAVAVRGANTNVPERTGAAAD